MVYAVKVKQVKQNNKDVEMLNKYPLLQEYKDVFLDDLLVFPPKL